MHPKTLWAHADTGQLICPRPMAAHAMKKQGSVSFFAPKRKARASYPSVALNNP